MPLVTTIVPANIAVELGVAAPSTGSNTEQQWETWISDADMFIQSRAEQLDVDVADIDQVKIDYVVRQAVAAHVKRPEDATQVTISVDDGSTSKSYRSGKGRVTIIDEWWVMLGLTDPEGAFSIDMAPATSTHLLWCAVSMGASYCSCGVAIAGFPIYEDPL